MAGATQPPHAPELLNAVFIVWLADRITQEADSNTNLRLQWLCRGRNYPLQSNTLVATAAAVGFLNESRLPHFKAMAYDGAACIVLLGVLHGESHLNKENSK